MIDLQAENADGMLNFFLKGKIDAQNVPTVKKEIDACLKGRGDSAVVFNAKNLSYVSSAGLKILPATQKEAGTIVFVANLRPEVSEIFKMAGFRILMDIKGF